MNDYKHNIFADDYIYYLDYKTYNIEYDKILKVIETDDGKIYLIDQYKGYIKRKEYEIFNTKEQAKQYSIKRLKELAEWHKTKLELINNKIRKYSE